MAPYPIVVVSAVPMVIVLGTMNKIKDMNIIDTLLGGVGCNSRLLRNAKNNKISGFNHGWHTKYVLYVQSGRYSFASTACVRL